MQTDYGPPAGGGHGPMDIRALTGVEVQPAMASAPGGGGVQQGQQR